MFASQAAVYKTTLNIIGSIIAALGMSFAIRAGFGSGTLAVLWQGMEVQLGISIGTASMIISVVILAAVLLIDRRQIHIGTVIHMVVYSLFLDVFGLIDLRVGYGPADFTIMILSVLIFSIGVAVYACADMGKGPYEALCFALQKKRKWKLSMVRIALDGITMGMGFLLGGQVGLCTIAFLIVSGPAIQKSVELLERSPFFAFEA